MQTLRPLPDLWDPSLHFNKISRRSVCMLFWAALLRPLTVRYRADWLHCSSVFTYLLFDSSSLTSQMQVFIDVLPLALLSSCSILGVAVSSLWVIYGLQICFVCPIQYFKNLKISYKNLDFQLLWGKNCKGSGNIGTISLKAAISWS